MWPLEKSAVARREPGDFEALPGLQNLSQQQIETAAKLSSPLHGLPGKGGRNLM